VVLPVAFVLLCEELATGLPGSLELLGPRVFHMSSSEIRLDEHLERAVVLWASILCHDYKFKTNLWRNDKRSRDKLRTDLLEGLKVRVLRSISIDFGCKVSI